MMHHHNNNITVVPTNNAYTSLYSPTTVTVNTIASTTDHNKNNNTAGNCTGATPIVTAAAMKYGTASALERATSDYYYYYTYDNVTETALFYPLNGTITKWIPAQQSLFQFSNICFLTAFIVPRSYKFSVLSLRALLFVGFLISGLWASQDVCAADALLWYGLLALINGVHTLRLCKKFLPPALSAELMELYVRVFKPLKISQKHFRELTREATIVELSPGECYAVEEVTACDERLSILLRGRCSVTCESTQLHNINSYQFIDSPEWMASNLMQGNGESVFQVTITAAEDSVYLCWQLSKLNRIFKHRAQLHVVLVNIIGKDITHKMYSLNEQLGQAKSFDDQSRAARNDHWRQAIYRSVSFDAVNTGTKGTVRSSTWKRYRDRKASLFADPVDSPIHGGRRKCWIPEATTQPSNSTTAYTSMDGHSSSSSVDEERESMLTADDISLYRLDGTTKASIVPPVVILSPETDSQHGADVQQLLQQRRPGSLLRRHNSNASNGREVKFNETVF